jgi:hypothetical protein
MKTNMNEHYKEKCYKRKTPVYYNI